MGDKITIIDSEGKEITCEVIALFNLPSFKKQYVAYTDGHESTSKKNLLVSSYTRKETGELDIEPIESEEEWTEVEKYLNAEVFGEDEWDEIQSTRSKW